MKRTFASIVLLVLVSMAGLAQTGSATPAAPAASPTPTIPTGNKVATISMQDAIAASNEGQRDFEALAKKFEPRRIELQKLNTEIEDLKKQNTNQGDKMSPEAHEALLKSIETKTKTLQRSAEDAQNEFQQAQNEVAQRIMQKLAPVLTKFVADNGYGLLIDQSAPWPQGPVVLSGPAFDITKPVVDAYNAVSGVPAPAKGATTTPRPASTSPGSTKPAATPAATTAKPAAPATGSTKPN